MLGCVGRANNGSIAPFNAGLHGAVANYAQEGGLGGAKYNFAPKFWVEDPIRQCQSRQPGWVTGGVVANYAVGQKAPG
jgi:hypothetical protein